MQALARLIWLCVPMRFGTHERTDHDTCFGPAYCECRANYAVSNAGELSLDFFRQHLPAASCLGKLRASDFTVKFLIDDVLKACIARCYRPRILGDVKSKTPMLPWIDVQFLRHAVLGPARPKGVVTLRASRKACVHSRSDSATDRFARSHKVIVYNFGM